MRPNAKKINIAIDGFSACGKSTLAQALARILQYNYIDSGAMYRAVTLYGIRHGINDSILSLLTSMLNDIKIECVWTDLGNKTILNAEDVTELIRSSGVQNLVSQVSAIPEIRRFLVAQQKEMSKQRGVVMDGRDIGTKVMPDAELKIFMQADLEIRVDRRMKELMVKGLTADRSEILQNLTFRDYIDSTRIDSPLSKAEDANILDNSNLTQDEQLKIVFVWVESAMNR
ncbi:MAG: (d)CMP kinase [Saprospiraceae bacterium]